MGYGAMRASDKHEIARIMHEKGVKASDIAEALGYTVQYVYNIVCPHNPNIVKKQPVDWNDVSIDYKWRK